MWNGVMLCQMNSLLVTGWSKGGGVLSPVLFAVYHLVGCEYHCLTCQVILFEISPSKGDILSTIAWLAVVWINITLTLRSRVILIHTTACDIFTLWTWIGLFCYNSCMTIQTVNWLGHYGRRFVFCMIFG